MLTLLFALSAAPSAYASLPVEPSVEMATTYTYAGADQQQKELGLDTIVAEIRKDPTATHYVWQPGWPAWKSWQEVPELKAAVDAANASAGVDAGMDDPELSYSIGGVVSQLKASEIARRVAAQPGAEHLAWKAGMPAWLPAGDVPEVKAKLDQMAAAAPPPATPTRSVEPPPSSTKTTKAGAASDPGRPTDEQKVKPMNVLRAFSGGAEVRAQLPFLYRYVNYEGEVVESTPLGAEVLRGRIWVDGNLGDYASTRVAVDGHQVNDSATLSDNTVVQGDGWGMTLPNAYAELHFGKKVVVGGRLGAQDVAFGSNIYFEDYDNYYVGARTAVASLEQKYGILPMYDVGLGVFAGSANEVWGVDVQLLNGTGVESPDDNFGRLILGRAQLHPGAFANGAVEVNAWVSGFYETTLVDNSGLSLGVSGAAELRVKRFARLYGEVFFGGQGTSDGTGYNGLGYQVAVAGGLPFSKGALDRIDVVLMDQAYSPRLGITVNELGPGDGGYALSAGLNVYWNTQGKGTLLTGLAYENYIPLWQGENVLHTGVLQMAAKF